MRVMHPSRDELRDRRERLLAEANIDRDGLERRAHAGLLTAAEYWLWEELRSIEFLLGEGERDAPNR